MIDRTPGSRDDRSEFDPARFWDLPLGQAPETPPSPEEPEEPEEPSSRPTREARGASGLFPPPINPSDALDFSLNLFESEAPGPHIAPMARRGSPQDGPRFPRPGELLDDFRIMRELGRGAFARVYLAEQIALASRMVALKVSSQPVADESQLLARLQHAHIVPIHSVHEDPATGLHLICMPYLGGANLAQVLEAAGAEAELASVATGGSLVHALDQVGGPPPSLPGGPSGTVRAERRGGPRSSIDEPGNHPGHAASAGASPSRVRSVLARYWARLADWSIGAEEDDPDDPDAEHAQPARRFLRHASSIQASAWIAGRLAEGLEHAHSRGLLHRDLKPSNILITADGMPMILDFNLSVVAEPDEAGSRARVGGTLPYMAPEHLDAFHPRGKTPCHAVDERSDLYSLGLILFEMVSGRHPFRDPPDGPPMAHILDEMIAERQAGPPSARLTNPEVPWSLEAILRKCLDPEPARRYQAAGDLAEDLRRFLDDRPLKYAPEPSLREQATKFLRRHPQLRSSTSVALVALVLISGIAGVLSVVRDQAQAHAASLALGDFQADFTRSQLLLNTASDLDHDAGNQLDLGLSQARDALGRFEVDERGDRWAEGPIARHLDPASRLILAEQLAELLMLEARAAVLDARQGPEGRYALALKRAIDRLDLAERIDPRPPSTLFAERASYAAALGLADQARLDRRRAAEMPPETARDYYLLGTAALAAGRPDQAEPLLDMATGLDTNRFWSWFALGLCHFDQGRFDAAASDFAASTILDEDSAWAHANRGLALALDGRVLEARFAYDRAVALDPDLVTARINRALASLELEQPRRAAADLEYAINRNGRRDPALLAAWGEALARSGRRDEADRRFSLALKDRPDDPSLLVARGFVRLPGDPDAARADFELALAASPRMARAHLGVAHVLRLDDPRAALGHLDDALKAEPGLIDAIQLRALVRARLGLRSALADVDHLRRSPTPHRLYNGSAALCLLSRASGDPGLLDDALVLLRRALDAGFNPSFARSDPDLEPLHPLPEFRALVGID
jgi:serine/threonine protein kinase/tetratricopeptide (TPR) repeat protein